VDSVTSEEISKAALAEKALAAVVLAGCGGIS